MGKHKNKALREQTILAKAGNEPVEVYCAKARIEGMRKHALKRFDVEDKRYFYMGGDNTDIYLSRKQRAERVRNGNHPDKIKQWFEERMKDAERIHDAYYLYHLEEYAKAVWLLHKADIEEARLKGENV